MKTLKINNLKVQVSGRKVKIVDTFKDICEEEIYVIARYLVEEGFIKNKDKSRIEVILTDKI